MTTRITPTFLLKGIDPYKVLNNYQSGFFDRPIPNKRKIVLSNTSTILAPTYGINNHSPVFSVKDRNNSTVIIATSNHENFAVYTSTGGDLPRGGRCDLCKDDFTETAMGYPLGYQEQTILINNSTNVNDAHYRIFYTFWVEGEFCSFECALGYIRLILSKPAEFRDTTMRDSERMLKMLYKLTYPTAQPLRPAQDYKLLKNNRGSLTKEEWKDYRHIYIRTERVLMIPAKVEYIKRNMNDQQIVLDPIKDHAKLIMSSS